MKHIDFYPASNIGQNHYNPVLSLEGGGGGGYGSMDELLTNPLIYSAAFTPRPVSSHTCSDGSTSAGSFREDQLMGLVFDPKCTEIAPLKHTWFPDSADFSYPSHYAAPDTSCSGNSPDSSNTGDPGMSDFGSWERQKKTDIGLEEMFAPSLKKKKTKMDEDLSQGGKIFADGSKLIPFGPTDSEGDLITTPNIGFQLPLQAGFNEYGSSGNPFNSNAKQHYNNDRFKEYTSAIAFNTNHNENGPCPSENTARDDATNTIITQLHQDDIRGFGLNPILGSPLAAIRCESDYNEICLVHLLIAGAEAVATRDMDLASVILVRLKELVSCTGSTMQRVATYFTWGLQCRIESGGIHGDRYHIEPQTDILTAFQILHEVSPYIKFGHFTANEAILEAVEEEQHIHIIDFEIMEGIQWPPLMQALASRKGGAPELKITALYRPYADRGLATVQETGKRLTEFALSLDVPFSFGLLSINSSEDEELNTSNIKLKKGEALVVNCMLNLPHMPHKAPTTVSSFFRGVRRLNPVVFTFVEEELGCGTTTAAASFFEALRHYSAVCDSLEVCLESETVARMLVERVFLAPRINSTVAVWNGFCRAEVRAKLSTDNWCSLLRALGFKPRPLSFHNVSQAQLLLGLYKDGFKLDERSDRLVLGWRERGESAKQAGEREKPISCQFMENVIWWQNSNNPP